MAAIIMIPKIAWAEDFLLWTEKWGRPNWWWWQWVIIIIIILILILLIIIIIIIQVERNYHSIAVQSCCRCCYGLRIRGWKLVKANNCPSITFDIVANLSEGWIFGNRKNCIFIRYLAVEVFCFMVILSPFNPLTMKAQQVAAAFNVLLKGKSLRFL